jgi:hypothetical protein
MRAEYSARRQVGFAALQMNAGRGAPLARAHRHRLGHGLDHDGVRVRSAKYFMRSLLGAGGSRILPWHRAVLHV